MSSSASPAHKLRNIPGITKSEWNQYQKYEKSSKLQYNSPLFVQQYIQQLIFENSNYSKNIFKLSASGEGESGAGADDVVEGSENSSTYQKQQSTYDDTSPSSNNDDDDEVDSSTDIDESNFIYEHFRLILKDFVAFFTWMSNIIDKDPQKYSKMKFELKGEEISFYRAGVAPTELVSVADYMMYTWNDAVRSVTNVENRMSIDDKIMKSLKDHTRRLYRLLAYAYFVHEEEFEKFERKHHLALKFTRYVRQFKLMKKKDMWISKSKLEKWSK